MKVMLSMMIMMIGDYVEVVLIGDSNIFDRGSSVRATLLTAMIVGDD